MRPLLVVFAAAVLLAACSKTDTSADDALAARSGPLPILILPRATQAAAATPATPAGSALFECSAPGSPSGMKVQETSSRVDAASNPISVIYYEPSGVTVFGLPAIGLEQVSDNAGWTGVAAYVAADIATVRTALMARFPQAHSDDGLVYAGGGIVSALRLETSTDNGTRLECAPIR